MLVAGKYALLVVGKYVLGGSTKSQGWKEGVREGKSKTAWAGNKEGGRGREACSREGEREGGRGTGDLTQVSISPTKWSLREQERRRVRCPSCPAFLKKYWWYLTCHSKYRDDCTWCVCGKGRSGGDRVCRKSERKPGGGRVHTATGR